ncbi:MAG TPA: cystathionine beta-lyase [Novosphingobium sp.]|nr:cystathionine beta-lyase [Novosphingobium sp.]HZV11310.1 cystathionine beta-lyase [Novosphingobium sp.]
MSETEHPPREQTRMIHPHEGGGQQARTAAPVLQRGTTVLLPACGAFAGPGPTYGRGGLATQTALRAALCDLEAGEGCVLYPSGLAALSGAILALCRAGDEIVMCDTIYAPTRRFVESGLSAYGVSLKLFDPASSPEEIAAGFSERTRLLVMESPGSLTLDMLDVPQLAALARARGVLSLVDNTFAAGVLFKPLEHGVDVSVQALTKYVCGHSDVFMGAAVARGEAAAMLRRSARDVGWTVSSDDAYLALRGLKTLHTRLARHGASALEVARWLADQPRVAEVLCPALPGARGHALFARDYAGTNGLVTVVLDGPMAATSAFLDSLALFGLGFSWGGFESLAIPCNDQLAQRQTGARWPQPVIRLHVGLEATADLIAELDQALARFEAACAASDTHTTPARARVAR